MTIFILSENHQETAQFLDDKSLDKMIRDIAQVLCNVHWLDENNDVDTYNYPNGIKWPVEWASSADCRCRWTQWARRCKANYLYLVELGLCCCNEQFYRGNRKFHKFSRAISWARDNVPSLKSCTNKEKLCTPECRESSCLWDREHTSVPLIMPIKYMKLWYRDSFYHEDDDIKENALINSYRAYYQAKIEQRYNKRPCLGTPHIFATVCIHCIWDSWWTNRQKPEFIKI